MLRRATQLAVLAFSLAPVAAQDTHPLTAIRWEPATAEAGFGHYLALPLGQPLDRERLREAVTLLHATGRFRDIAVFSEPNDTGVTLLVRTQPMPRLASVRVDGDPVLSASKARRAAGLQHGDPLDTARLERAARDVALALAARGYLEAAVSARAEGEPEVGTLVFDVRSGPRARIGSVRVDGVPGGATALPQDAPAVGAPFIPERAEKAADWLREAQQARGFWRARVELGHVYDPSTASVALRYEVERGPLLRVEFEGDDVPGGLRRRAAADAVQGGLEGDARDEAIERIEEGLRSRGHREATVQYREDVRLTETVGVFGVAAGPRSEVASVVLRGDAPADLPLPETLLRPGEPLEDRRLDADLLALREALEALGHAQAQVEAEVPDAGGQVPVVYRVESGPRTIVRSVRVESSIACAVGGPRELRLREGRPYRLRDLAQARGTLLVACRNAGHLRTEVVPELVFSEDHSQLDVVLRVEPGPRTEVGRIVVSGLDRTRESTVRRELALEEGGPLGFEALLDSQRRLGALGIFSSVELVELNPEASQRRHLVVRAREAPTLNVAYGLGYSEREKIRASIEFTRSNLGGAGRSVTVFARGSAKGSRFLATYREPYLFGRRRELLTSAFREEDDRDNFDYVRWGALLQTIVNLTPPRRDPRTSLILRYTFEETETFNVTVPCDEVDRQFCSASVSGPSAAIIDDSRDDPLDPQRGHFVSGDVQLSLEALGGNSFLRGFFQAALFRRASSRLSMALGSRVGLARTFGLGEPLRLPLPERFFAGGAYTLRGFPEDQVEPEGGNAVLLANAELRVRLGRSIALAVFSDIGNVFPLTSEIDLGNLRYTAGLGLRYRTAVGPVRLDWGYKLNRRPGESASEFHVTIGHAF